MVFRRFLIVLILCVNGLIAIIAKDKRDYENGARKASINRAWASDFQVNNHDQIRNLLCRS